MGNTKTFTSKEKKEIVDYFLSNEKYSGKPEDYLGQFLSDVNYLPDWPESAKNWAMNIMNDHKNNPNDGIVVITKVLVDDGGNYQNTNTLTSTEKMEIVNYLLSNETYMEAARKHFGSLLEESESPAPKTDIGGNILIEKFRSLFTILTNEEKYSGKPEDYLDRFHDAVNYLPDWPADGKD